MLVTSAITEAWYLSGMVPADTNTPDPGQVSDGLTQLNRILRGASRTGTTIPYVTHQSVNLTPNTEVLFVADLIKIASLTYQLTSNVRFSLTNDSRKEYFDTGRVTNISSLPNQYHFERVKGGANIYLYFIPNQNYPLNITGWYGLSSVALGDDLSTTYDDFYIEYLIYALAEKLCILYSMEVPQATRIELDGIKQEIKDLTTADYTTDSPNLFQGKSVGIWGQATLGQGWLP